MTIDRQLLLNLGLTLISSVLILVCIKVATSIHLPYFVTPALAAGLGFLEPRRGWLLAAVQTVVIWLGYKLVVPTPDNTADADIEAFGLYGSMILTFVGSFIGGLLKRGLDKG
ncbi:hypothetical protein [Spirosoma rigui]|uniref:hypothetical protein n=1 Tax=Spirosoma rigui TaxID=564064 RepID=UPI0009AF50C7|nr:hypothetical protein [Spirosoma rigui]